MMVLILCHATENWQNSNISGLKHQSAVKCRVVVNPLRLPHEHRRIADASFRSRWIGNCAAIILSMGMICTSARAGPIRFTVAMQWDAAYSPAKLNNVGEVVGTINLPSNVNHAFSWTSGTGNVDLGVGANDSYSNAYAVNDLGQVAGYNLPDSQYHGAPFPGSTIAINDSGVETGSYGNSPSPSVWTPATGFVPNTYIEDPYSINNYGEAVGGTEDNIGDEKAIYYSPSTGVIRIPAFDHVFSFSDARDINAAGHIVGEYGPPQDQPERAYLLNRYDAQSYTDLVPLSAGGLAVAINDSDSIVGHYTSASATSDTPFIWDPTDGPRDLNSLIDPTLGITLQDMLDINNSNQLLATGTLNGQSETFLLSPVPETGALAILIGMVTFIVPLRHRRHHG